MTYEWFITNRVVRSWEDRPYFREGRFSRKLPGEPTLPAGPSFSETDSAAGQMNPEGWESYEKQIPEALFVFWFAICLCV